jgi:protein-S-isoprenylcysteine O-methyltransferase Ste14
MEHSGIVRKMVGRLLLLAPAMAAIFFIPAGTLAYWEAWVYMAVLLIPMAFVLRYFLRTNPEFLERRMQMRERENTQRRIIALSFLWYLPTFILPGLDQRFGWSDVPVPVVIAADLLVLLGYALIFLVFRENQYAARTVQVEQGQQVITTGPYTIVRHPMYLGTMVMYLASPVALGSTWALIPALLIIPLLVARIVNEEKVLERDLRGYAEYRQATRYRLVPGIW